MLREILRMMYPQPGGFGRFRRSTFWESAETLTELGFITSMPASLKVNNTLIELAMSDILAAGEFTDVDGLEFSKPSLEFRAPRGTSHFKICEGFEATLCPAGHEAVGHGQCSPCPVGDFVAEERQGNRCGACAAGSYAETPRSIRCQVCPPGSSQNQTGQASCDLCVAGRFQEVPEQSSCNPCWLGRWSATGSTTCKGCVVGSFSRGGATSCELCPGGRTTLANGSVKLSDCVCIKGAYANNGGDICTDCGVLRTTLANGATSPRECYFNAMFYVAISVPIVSVFLALVSLGVFRFSHWSVKRIKEEQRRTRFSSAFGTRAT